MRMYFTQDTLKPSLSTSRQRKPAEIPPFSSDYLAKGDSGMWYPPRSILITGAIFTCQEPGFSQNRLEIMKFIMPRQYEALSSIILASTTTEKSFNAFKGENSVNPAIITPSEPIFLRSSTDSDHQGVVIQVVGFYL